MNEPEFKSERFYVVLSNFITEMGPVYEVVDRSSPVHNPLTNNKYKLALKQLESARPLVDELVTEVESYVRLALKEAFGQDISLERLRLATY